MDFFFRRGEDFSESFDFKNAQGKSIPLPAGDYKLLLTRGDFGREYTISSGLTRQRASLVWNIAGSENKDFAYNTLYYTLYLNDTELARGVLKAI